jgi:hypothetical protein
MMRHSRRISIPSSSSSSKLNYSFETTHKLLFVLRERKVRSGVKVIFFIKKRRNLFKKRKGEIHRCLRERERG